MSKLKSVKADALEVAQHFVKVTEERATPAIMAKTVSQAKVILSSGYSKEEVIRVIDYCVNVKKVKMYSIGYVSVSINSVLSQLNKEDIQQRATQIRKEQETSFAEVETKEVIPNDESKKRNQDRSSRLGVQPRIGTEPYLDLFKKQ